MKLLIALLISSKVFAQDCGEIKDGGSSRLDSPGKSLDNTRVQDQDGLGTCYANTASVMLQSAMPNSPEISYLQLSVNHAEKTVAKELRSQGKKQAFTDKGSLLIDGGFSCETINLAKDSGGVCLRDDVALEKMIFKPSAKQYTDPDWSQLDLLKKVSNYYDGMLKSFGSAISIDKNKKMNIDRRLSPSGFAEFFKKATSDDSSITESNKSNLEKKALFENYKEALNKVINENQENYAKKSCEKLDLTNSSKVVSDIVIRLQNIIESKTSLPNPVYKYTLMRIKMGKAITYNTDGIEVVKVEISDDLKKNLTKNYLANLTSENHPTSGLEALKNSLLKMSKDFDHKILDEAMKDLSPEDLKLLDSDYKRYALKDFSECKDQGKIEYLKNDDGLIHDFTELKCNNDYLAHVENLQQLVVGLDKYNFDNIDRINDFITNLPNLNYDQAIMKLLAPSCNDSKKVKIPKELTCETKAFHYPVTEIDTPSEIEKNLTQMRKDFAKDTTESIARNKAMGLSMCTAFFDANDTTSFYTKTNQCGATGKHGFHAVSMIGYKCEKGKMKYLIQNSWGNWASAEPKFEKDSYGKAWMEEDDLIKNTYQLDILK